ncbi:uncharacterized protein LOC106664642 isoform X2 [Cimex lectularius]|nr:uncharacterized protein LOC106664642 isoform X2 [Cimex lectularius]
MKFDEYIEKLDSSRPKRYFVITIIGASHKATPTLIYELLRARFCIDQHGTIIHLYDEDERKLEKLKDKVEDLNYMEGLLNARSTIKMFNDLKKALEGVRLLIFLGDESKGKYQKLSRQLRYCYYQYKTLAKTMEPFLNEDVHVVFTCMDYRCFIASVFARFCNSINVYKVVAITSHLALEPTSYMAKATGLPRSHFKYQTSIVWGCVGLSHCVDLANGDVLYNLMRFKNNLPPEDFETMDDITKEFKHEYWGEDNWILRRQDYLVKGLKNTWYYVGRQKEYLFMYMNTKTYISQIKATIDTLESWYDPCPKDNRLSAGINSDGNYGFPLGLFMSQPVYVDKKTREWRVKPNILKSKDLLNLTDLVLFPLSLIRRLVHGHVFQEIIIDQDFLSLVQIGDIVIKQKKEQERLERERLERERLLEEEGLFEEEEGEELEEEEEEEEEEMVNEEFLNVEAEEPSPHETSERQTDFEDESEEGSHEELELEHSRSGSLAPDNDHEEAVEEESHGPNIAPFLDATYINDKGLQYYIGLTEKCEPMLDSELNEEQRALLNLINEFRGKPVKEAFILRKKEVYPPNGVRPFNRRSTADRAKDPAFLVARPVKFIEVPVLSIQWKEIKKVIERLQQLRKKSRKQILEYYANKVMYIFNMKDNKRQINKQNESFNIDPILSDDEQYPEYDITQRVKSTAYMDTSFLFKSDFNIDFQVQDTRPLPKEFTEPQDAYEKRAFISTLQAVEDYAEKVYHKNAKSLHV